MLSDVGDDYNPETIPKDLQLSVYYPNSHWVTDENELKYLYSNINLFNAKPYLTTFCNENLLTSYTMTFPEI